MDEPQVKAFFKTWDKSCNYLLGVGSGFHHRFARRVIHLAVGVEAHRWSFFPPKGHRWSCSPQGLFVFYMCWNLEYAVSVRSTPDSASVCYTWHHTHYKPWQKWTLMLISNRHTSYCSMTKESTVENIPVGVLLLWAKTHHAFLPLWSKWLFWYRTEPNFMFPCFPLATVVIYVLWSYHTSCTFNKSLAAHF